MILALYSFRENSEDNEDDMELDVDREADSSGICICSQMDGGIQMQKKKKCPEV